MLAEERERRGCELAVELRAQNDQVGGSLYGCFHDGSLSACWLFFLASSAGPRSSLPASQLRTVFARVVMEVGDGGRAVAEISWLCGNFLLLRAMARLGVLRTAPAGDA